MTVYCVCQAKDVDGEILAKYREHAPSALKKHGGSVVVNTRNLIALDGTTDANDAIVLLSFPSEEHAKSWRNDPELEFVHDLRNSSGHWTIQLLGAM